MLVYKYRSGNNKDLNALNENKYWASNTEGLNDPCEGITDNKRIKWLLGKLGKWAGAESKENYDLINDNTDEVLSLDKNLGIYSLTLTPLDELLWAHYANKHEGFCIGYDSELLTNEEKHVYSSNVIYSNSPAISTGLEYLFYDKEDIIKKTAFYKSKRWEYEKEFRIISNKLGYNFYQANSLKSIHFGLRISDEIKQNVLKILKGRSVDFFQIELEKDSYNFIAKRIII